MKEFPTTSLSKIEAFLCTNLGDWFSYYLVIVYVSNVHTSCCFLAPTLYRCHFFSPPQNWRWHTQMTCVFIERQPSSPPRGLHIDYLLVSLRITLHNSLVVFYKIMYYMSMNYPLITGYSFMGSTHVDMRTFQHATLNYHSILTTPFCLKRNHHLNA